MHDCMNLEDELEETEIEDFSITNFSVKMYVTLAVCAYNVYMCGRLGGKSKSALLLTLFS
ncbi:hypothetical protein HanPI659440_Chr12g0444721 [Helianthus annuus]|nr:hypothetical protein HanPI659440_Chr12g0444721 [Helianthus annuus]